MKTVGVILGGGVGARFGATTPKQFLKLAGRMVIEHTVDVFEKSPHIDEIVVVTRLDYVDQCWHLVNLNGWSKVTKVIVGGNERMDSTYSAIKSLNDYDDGTKVLLHDAVRPFVTEEILHRCVAALDVFPAVDVVIPSSDTIVAVHDNGCISSIPPRSTMRRGQTPQAFTLGVLKQAYEKALAGGLKDFTCDCGVVRGMLPHLPVATVQGADTNIKVTTPTDLFLAEKLMQSRTSDLTNEADLRSLAGKRLVLFGGSSGIGKSIRDLALVNGAEAIVASRSSNSVDVADFNSVNSFLAKVASDDRPIDAIVNTAGILIKRPLSQMTHQQINEMVAINYHGAINVASAAREHLIRSRGALINFTSSSYTRGRAYYAIYSSTKSAIVNLTQALAEEWHNDGIRVHCINPERTKTPMRTANFGIEDPLTLLDPDDVARTTLTAISANSTGLIIDVRRTSIPGGLN
ncbi:bifunctional cytidylyltransferase/SDR family oxidoreductase [Agrobacterium sp. rho-13.3]|jgi:2-C-methyl-D-erythritol 4-phosphate cytidylyltransferase|uniref:bifunctional cytidylyltransferase/SDR family oxidoreductase n=1 Tax=Agrobacterium sp. rho-13.3 TaxID=3072980 RepID=UPI002A183B71|nr:bifunctional cytidylyltransferase/SDR family oxidoreductase [Agrobacterium sp. rho-13.3]MDX8308634.1 bifunctional cytidylyltransferase/SDR family oxidoreductase [Agrobacterium sp. rho-13.3]